MNIATGETLFRALDNALQTRAIGQLPLPAGEVGDKRFQNLANFCKLLLVLPHSTADPERLFSVIGKIDTSQQSSLLPSTVCDNLSVKLNVDEECFQSKKHSHQSCCNKQKLPLYAAFLIRMLVTRVI